MSPRSPNHKKALSLSNDQMDSISRNRKGSAYKRQNALKLEPAQKGPKKIKKKEIKEQKENTQRAPVTIRNVNQT